MVMAALILMVTNIQGVSANIANVQSKLDAANQIIEMRQSKKQELINGINQIKARITAARSSSTAFEKAERYLRSRAESINGDLAVTMASLPSKIFVAKINRNRSKLVISGIAPTEEDVLTYARNLDMTGRFLQITITTVARSELEEAPSLTAEDMGKEVSGEAPTGDKEGGDGTAVEQEDNGEFVITETSTTRNEMRFTLTLLLSELEEDE
jgi:hypothetical protein